MSTEQQGQPADPGQESSPESGAPTDILPNQEPPESQSEKPEGKMRAYLKTFGTFLIKPKTLLEIAALIVVICYTRYSGQQVQTMNDTLGEVRKQNGILQRQLEAADRPWVKAQISPSHEIFYNPDGAGVFSFRITVNNIGRSVATDVVFRLQVFVPKWGQGVFKEPVERQRRLCGTPPTSTVKASPSEFRIVFPNEPVGDNFSSDTDLGQMRDNAMPNPAGTGINYNPVLIGCVDYSFPAALRRHQTGFIYEISRFDPKRDPNHSLSLKVGLTVPINAIVLERYYFGGDYAY